MVNKCDFVKKILFVFVIFITFVLFIVASVHRIIANGEETHNESSSVTDVIDNISSSEDTENSSESVFESEDESKEEISDFSEDSYEGGFMANATHGTLEGVYVKSPHCFVYNETDNVILYEKDAFEKTFPASVTKLLTAAVALEYVPLDTVFLVGEEILKVGPNSSMAYIAQGESYYLKDLLYALLLPSGNDAAYTIAVNTARYLYGDELTIDEAVSKFMELSNSKAVEIGAYNTNFTAPDGYHDDNHYTSAYDMTLISVYACTFEEIKEACKVYEYYCKTVNGEGRGWKNTNPLLNKHGSYYCPLVTGLKTGSTDEAGKCLSIRAEKDGKSIIIVILGASDVSIRNTDMLNIIHSVFGECK